jgi:hypothetical protein
VSGAPALVYGLQLEIGGRRYEVRAERGAAPALSSIQLLECDTVCTPTTDLAGSIGVTGHEVVVSVPLTAVGASPGDLITGLRASTGAGHPVAGTPSVFDDMSLPDTRIPAPSVTLKVVGQDASGGTETSPVLSAGRFSAKLPASADAAARLHARVCLGVDCGDVTVPVRQS